MYCILQKEDAINRRPVIIIHQITGQWLWMKMWGYVNSVLMSFRGCFSRYATFCCFVIIVVGLMLRCDVAGISSIVRTLALLPVNYEGLVHFFVPARGAFCSLKNIGYALLESQTFCSWKTGCLFLSGTG